MEYSKFKPTVQKSGEKLQKSESESDFDKEVQRSLDLLSLHFDKDKSKEGRQKKKTRRKMETKPGPHCHVKASGDLENTEKTLCVRLLNATKLPKQDRVFLKKVSNPMASDALIFCRALFLSNYAKMHICEEDLKIIEEIILQYTNVKDDVELKHITMSSLPHTVTNLAKDVMKAYLGIESSLISDLDVFGLYCIAIRSIVNHCGYMHSETMTMEWSVFRDVPSVVWCIVDFFDYLRTSLNIEIQALFSSEKLYGELNENMLLQFTKIEKCLTVLEHVLTNSRWVKVILEHKNCQFMNSINGVFGFCLDNLFQNHALMKQELNGENGKISELLLDCVVIFIKMFNSLAAVTCDKSFISKCGLNKFGIFLSQRMLICFFEFNRRNLSSKFRMEIVCLEILFAIIYKMWITKKQFLEVMTMNIQVGNHQNTSVQFLIKSLLDSLEEIKILEAGAIKSNASGSQEPSFYSILNTPVPMEEDDILLDSFRKCASLSSGAVGYSFRNADFLDLYNALSRVDWRFLEAFEDVNLAVDAFYEYIYYILDAFVPHKRNSRRNFPPCGAFWCCSFRSYSFSSISYHGCWTICGN